jgi:putative nucleotidyltransferase with HDIG domain
MHFNNGQAETADADKDSKSGTNGEDMRDPETKKTNPNQSDVRSASAMIIEEQHDEKKMFRRKYHENPLLQKISIKDDLPSLPHILLKLIQKCGDDSSTVTTIGKIMEQDPSLCFKMLQIVNSSYYNLQQRISSIQHALSMLGIDVIKNIAMTAAVCQAFDGLQNLSGFNLKVFWWHSLKCAIIGEKLAQKIRYPRPDEAFLAGLLHDIGKLVLIRHAPEKYLTVLNNQGRHVDLTALESRDIGVTHAEIGSWLLDRWQMQSLIHDAVYYHHEPSQRIMNAFPLVKIIYIANILSTKTDSIQQDSLAFAGKVLGIGLDDLEKVGKETDEKLADAANSFQIEIESPEDDTGSLTEKDKEIQGNLRNQVRQFSLLHGTLQNLLHAHDIDSIISAARNGIQIVFDLRSVMFFLYRSSDDILIGTCDRVHSSESLGELSISCTDDKSVLVAALRSLKKTDSFSKDASSALSITDEQIIRLLDCEGISCFPMKVQGQPVGVLVLGLEEKQLSVLQEEASQLEIFLDYASLALHTENVRRAQAKAILDERIATTTSMARKVTHEVNNPLSIIKNYLMVLQLSLEEKGIQSQEILIIKDEIDRVSRIMDQLSDLSTPSLEQFLPIDLNELLQNTVTLIIEPLARKNITVNLEFSDNVPIITSARDSLKQVFINLIKNAAEALEEGGNITISTMYLAGLDKVEIQIKDNGPGIPEPVKSRLFEPYTTTKDGAHSGLGLSVVQSIIGELKGEISCQSEKGQGTAFSIVLPLTGGMP